MPLAPLGWYLHDTIYTDMILFYLTILEIDLKIEGEIKDKDNLKKDKREKDLITRKAWIGLTFRPYPHLGDSSEHQHGELPLPKLCELLRQKNEDSFRNQNDIRN